MIYTPPQPRGLDLPRFPRTRRGKPSLRHTLWLLIAMMSLLTTVTDFGRALLLSQLEARVGRQCYAGPILVGVTAGCHINRRMAITVQYHPNNNFSTGDSIGLGFGEDNYVYGQEGIEAYRNLDAHTWVINGRLYIVGPFFVSFGLAYQRGSSRWITFGRDDRQIGDNNYEDITATVETRLKPQTAPVIALGAHPTWLRAGFMGEVNIGLTSPKQIDEIIVTTDTPLTDTDLALFKEQITQDAESEGFGIATFGPTIHFGLPRS